MKKNYTKSSIKKDLQRVKIEVWALAEHLDDLYTMSSKENKLLENAAIVLYSAGKSIFNLEKKFK